MFRKSLSFVLVYVVFSCQLLPAQQVYMKDTPADTGAEPNPDTGPMWVTAFRSVSVIQAVPPAVTLLAPGPEAAMRRGETITVSAQASDRNGKVKEVQFWVREADLFLSKASLVSAATSAPYKGLIKELKPGHYTVWAVAVNDRGAFSQPMPVHVMVR